MAGKGPNITRGAKALCRLTPALLLTAVMTSSGQSGPPVAFEVASVKPTQHGRNAEGTSFSSDPETPSPGTFRVINNSLEELIRWAYRVKEYQVSGPKWLNDDSECFDIQARMPPGAPKAQLPLMLRTLLEERFKLALHRETRTLPVYELMIAKGGPRLDRAKPDAKTGISYEGKFWSQMRSQSTTATEFASFLSDRLRRTVIDKTGIQTRFALNLEYRNNDDDTTRPSIFGAIQEKMGLSLKAAKGPVEILVIDHVEKMPSAN